MSANESRTQLRGRGAGKKYAGDGLASRPLDGYSESEKEYEGLQEFSYAR